MDRIRYMPNTLKTGVLPPAAALFSERETERVFRFHQSMGEKYNETPLCSLDAFAKRAGLHMFFVKDESKRGTLKAFKLLGGSFAVANCICERLGIRLEDVDFNYLKSREAREKLGEVVFAAASDGNHGKSVAWAAHEFGQKAIVYMPKGTAQDRIEAIESLGGRVVVTDYSYDWCVREVDRLADKKGWIAVPDTAGEGDKRVASWVMQGYATMAAEAIRQLNGIVPTHMFLQAGVGSMAAAMAAVFADRFGKDRPKIYIMEPHQAACFYESGAAGDGSAHSVDGEMDSIMAGLSCGVPNPVSWEIIKNLADGFFSADDVLAANGMRILGNPLAGDPRVIAGESGAVGTGLIDELMRKRPDMAKKIGLDRRAAVLTFSTEGDTDTRNYRETVWYGKHSDQAVPG